VTAGLNTDKWMAWPSGHVTDSVTVANCCSWDLHPLSCPFPQLAS